MKTSLGLVVARRNKIVHSCDTDALDPRLVVDINDEDALGSIDTIDLVVRGIDAVI